MYTYKQVEEMLKSYQTIKAEIKNIELDIQDIEKNAGFKGMNDDPKPSTPTYRFNSSVENDALSISREKAISKLKVARNDRQREIDRIENMLSILSEQDEEIIRLRYFKRVPISIIANKLDRTSGQVSYRRRCAISDMINILNISKKVVWMKNRIKTI